MIARGESSPGAGQPSSPRVVFQSGPAYDGVVLAKRAADPGSPSDVEGIGPRPVSVPQGPEAGVWEVDNWKRLPAESVACS